MIQNSNSQSFALREHAARLGPNHGYSIEGDIALLHAEVAVPRDPQLDSALWALQLWACDAPHAGGPLSGIKVAEATLPSTPHSAEPQRLDTEALASVPGGLRDYSMVLVLASGEPGSFNQVHDFANYPERQRFITPHLEGSVGFRIDADHVVLRAERIPNPRRLGNLSGSLSLELWALPHAYQSGTPRGTRLAALDLGSIAGQDCLESIEQRSAFQPPAAGSWQAAMLLREWAGPAGYVTRDYCNFALPYEVVAAQPDAAAKPPAPALAAPEPEKSVTTVREIAVPAVARPVTREPARAVTREPAREAATKAVAAAASSASSPKLEASAPTPALVSIMHASLDELAQVKGLNRKLAVEIIKQRPFASFDDLQRVRGIGAKLIVTLRGQLKL